MAGNGVNHRESIAAANLEVKRREGELQSIRQRLQDTSLRAYARSQGYRESGFAEERFKCCKTLSGHTGKIYSLDWCKDRIVSASQDGRLIVWNAITSQKTHVMKLQCPWVIACAFSPDEQTVACGGLDNILSVYNLKTQDAQANVPSATLQGHKGYISCCRFVDKSRVLTSSGDSNCILWDVEQKLRLDVFGETPSAHTSDVMSVCINRDQFISGSCDGTAKLWDIRNGRKAQLTFFSYTDERRKDVNAVQFMPDGVHFGVGLDDGVCKVFDLRYGYELQEYRLEDHNRDAMAVTAIAFSLSGGILFAAYGAQAPPGFGGRRCLLWDTIDAEVLCDLGENSNGHNRQVSCIGVSSDGTAVCTGSWDCNLKVWASDR